MIGARVGVATSGGTLVVPEAGRGKESLSPEPPEGASPTDPQR